MNLSIDHIKSMAHSPIRNYGIPGVTSWLIGSKPEPGKGCVRLFESSREHLEKITPHSHRFDLHCVVLRGWVVNTIFERDKAPGCDGRADQFFVSEMRLNGGAGYYAKPEAIGVERWSRTSIGYQAGDAYSMKADQVHTIQFSRDALVLFFEGPQVSSASIILEPHVDGEHIPTFKVEPWMFQRDAAMQGERA